MSPFENTLIIIDDSKIGGIQRLALDQSYYINSHFGKSEIVVLNSKPKDEAATFEKSEKNLMNELGIKYIYLPGARFNQMIKLIKLFKQQKYQQIVSHSLRGSIFLYFVCTFGSQKAKLSTVIHQLPSLSSPSQRFRRFLYSYFTQRLFIFSEAGKLEWDHLRKKNIIIRTILSKKEINVCRNGIFLPRLEEKLFSMQNSSLINKRLVFIGRLRAWKGIDKFLEIAQNTELVNYKILLVTATDPSAYVDSLPPDLRNRIQVEVGKSISELNFYPGDVHLYPVDYGPNSLAVEGVSINVLEMASLGIVSLISKNGSVTWKELESLNLVKEVNWSDLKEVIKVILELKNDTAKCNQNQVLELVSIKNYFAGI